MNGKVSGKKYFPENNRFRRIGMGKTEETVKTGKKFNKSMVKKFKLCFDFSYNTICK